MTSFSPALRHAGSAATPGGTSRATTLPCLWISTCSPRSTRSISVEAFFLKSVKDTVLMYKLYISVHKRTIPLSEAQQIIKSAQTQYDSAQNEADRRESKLRSMEQLSAAVGNNNDAANYLTSQILNDGLSRTDESIVSRQRLLPGQ